MDSLVENTSISSRLKVFIHYQKISIRKFEKSCNITLGVVSKAISKNTDFGVKVLIKIKYQYPELNMEWLLTGKGEMIFERKGNELDGWLENEKASLKDIFKYSNRENVTLDQIAELKDAILQIKNLKENMEYFKQSDLEKTKQIEGLLQIINKMAEKHSSLKS